MVTRCATRRSNCLLWHIAEVKSSHPSYIKMGKAMSSTTYDFTNNWFEDSAKGVWDSLIPQINPTRILEIGSYEGASTCFLIEKLAASKEIEIHCVDTWEGGVEHAEVNMSDLAPEKRTS